MNTQPRKPAGSTEGGQFTATAGAEVGNTVITIVPEHVPVQLCADCTYSQENENPNPQYTSNSTCEDCHDSGVDCRHDGYAPEEFASTPCDKCGTTLAGYRAHYAYWPTPDDKAPATYASRDDAINEAVVGRLQQLGHDNPARDFDLEAIADEVLARHPTTGTYQVSVDDNKFKEVAAEHRSEAIVTSMYGTKFAVWSAPQGGTRTIIRVCDTADEANRLCEQVNAR